MEAAIVLFGIFYIVQGYRTRAAVRFSKGQTEAYGRALCDAVVRKAAAHRERSEPHHHTDVADEAERVHWAGGSFSPPERTEEAGLSKEVLA